MAVTAYQNHRVRLVYLLVPLETFTRFQITELKIESNPFAKGFRECELDENIRHTSSLLSHLSQHRQQLQQASGLFPLFLSAFPRL